MDQQTLTATPTPECFFCGKSCFSKINHITLFKNAIDLARFWSCVSDFPTLKSTFGVDKGVQGLKASDSICDDADICGFYWTFCKYRDWRRNHPKGMSGFRASVMDKAQPRVTDVTPISPTTVPFSESSSSFTSLPFQSTDAKTSSTEQGQIALACAFCNVRFPVDTKQMLRAVPPNEVMRFSDVAKEIIPTTQDPTHLGPDTCTFVLNNTLLQKKAFWCGSCRNTHDRYFSQHTEVREAIVQSFDILGTHSV
jgi:hypothetical protein